MHMAYAAPTLVFGAISALGFFLAQRKANKVKFFQQEELEVSQVKAGGVCNVLGTVTEAPGRYSIAKGKSPFVLSDTDSGQVAYAENSKMYVTRFWAGAAGLMASWWLWHWVR